MPVYTFALDEVNLNRHHCELVVFECVDFRFRELLEKFVREVFGVGDFDVIKFPGGAKNFASASPLREDFANAIANVCVTLHGVQKVLVMNHWDCGAYGGSKSFVSSDDEERTHVSDLAKAKAFLDKRFPALTILAGYSKLTDHGLDYYVFGESDLERVAIA